VSGRERAARFQALQSGTLENLAPPGVHVRRCSEGSRVADAPIGHRPLRRGVPERDEAVAPVLTFDGGPDWEILVYFVKSDARARQALADAVQNRLLSVELVPKKKRSFAKIAFPAFYRRERIITVDAAWDEYSNGSGLVYEVYTTRTPYGDERPGDLNRIRYGPSDEAKVEHARR
jgi:hypothetical protein